MPTAIAIWLALSVGTADPASKARSAYDEARYFDLVALAPKLTPTPENRFLRGLAYVGQNNFKLGIPELRGAARLLSGELKWKAYEHLIAAFARTGRYRDAENAAAEALAQRSGPMDDAVRSDFENSRSLWGSLRAIPSMRTTIRGSSRIQNPSGHQFNIAFLSQGKKFSLGFDTGANLSLVREGMAKRMGLRMITAKIRLGSITGGSASPWLGVADELRFGRASLRHVVFLVMRDRDLYFPAAKFQLDGVIGLPVLTALGEMTFCRDGTTEIPAAPRAGGRPNLFAFKLMMLSYGSYRAEPLTFMLDTGANKTTLYPPFARRFAKEIDSRGFPRSHTMAGVAGLKETPGFLLTDLELGIADRRVVLPSVDCISAYRSATSRFLYANVGRDAFEQFDRVTFNWKAMRVDMENTPPSEPDYRQ